MRRMVVAAVVACSMLGMPAWAEEAKSVIDMSVPAPGVVVSAIPSPAPVVEVLKLEDPVIRARSAKKLRLAKKKASPILMLTRTERRQMALLDDEGKLGKGHIYIPTDNGQGGLDQLDLHRSFSRPRVVDEPADEHDEIAGLSPHVRLRLLIARLRAVEAHALNQVADNDDAALPESIQQRLQAARMKAVEVHRSRFG